jgi:hypothetical protein
MVWQGQKKWEEVVFWDSGTEVCLMGANRRPENTNKPSSHATNEA